MPRARLLAFGGDARLQSALLDRLDAHRDAGTIDPAGPSWTGTGGTPAGCIAASSDPAVFADATGFPAPFMPLLDFLCARSREPRSAVTRARAWLTQVRPGADLAGVPSRLVCALLETDVPADEREADLAAVQMQVSALHRRMAEGDRPEPAAWRAARAAAVVATDGARGPVGRRHGRLAETAAWDPLTASTVLRETAAAWLEIRTAGAAAATDWSEADGAAMERCFQLCRSAYLDTGGPPDGFFFPPLFRARDPHLADRFEARLAAANAASRQAVEALADLCLTHLAAAEMPGARSVV